MIDFNDKPLLQKTATIWSQRRERQIVVRIYFNTREQDGCRIYTLRSVEEL
jgi:hypothetical protein